MARLFYEHDDAVQFIELPLSVSEIPFESFCDFRTEEEQYFAFMREGNQSKALAAFVHCLSQIVGGDLRNLPLATHAKEFDERCDSRALIQPGEELTLNAIYAHIHVLINDYTPEEIPTAFEFNHGGHDFEIKSKAAARIIANTPLTTGEVIETLEYQRASLGQEQAKKLATGNIDFTLGLAEFALLVRQPGEDLPAGGKKLKRFVAKRQELFKTLPLDVVLNLRFFLLNSLLEYGRMRAISSSSTARRKSRGKNRKGKGKRRRGRK